MSRDGVTSIGIRKRLDGVSPSIGLAVSGMEGESPMSRYGAPWIVTRNRLVGVSPSIRFAPHGRAGRRV